jgi:hypothetical protein
MIAMTVIDMYIIQSSQLVENNNIAVAAATSLQALFY